MWSVSIPSLMNITVLSVINQRSFSLGKVQILYQKAVQPKVFSMLWMAPEINKGRGRLFSHTLKGRLKAWTSTLPSRKKRNLWSYQPLIFSLSQIDQFKALCDLLFPRMLGSRSLLLLSTRHRSNDFKLLLLVGLILKIVLWTKRLFLL